MKPVQETETIIQIDQKKGKWPFLKVAVLTSGKLGFFIDCNEGGQIVGQDQGKAVMTMNRKKVERLRDFLTRMLDEERI